MTTYEACSLMIQFAMLVLIIVSSKNRK
ncbi:putative holin-like toxin [Sporolactobacillus sp. STSJ-5]